MFKTKNLIFKEFLRYNDIHILKEKVNFIQGPSGCGKSTLFKLLNKTENFSDGDILFNDKPISQYESISLRKTVKLISQTAFLFPNTIIENFEIFHEYCNCKCKLNDSLMLDFMNLTSADLNLDTNCDNLSGGEKQRVYIAICLSMECDVVMLDEPTSALDSILAHKVIENIIDYVKINHKTLIVISHDTALVNEFAENIILLIGEKYHE